MTNIPRPEGMSSEALRRARHDISQNAIALTGLMLEWTAVPNAPETLEGTLHGHNAAGSASCTGTRAPYSKEFTSSKWSRFLFRGHRTDRGVLRRGTNVMAIPENHLKVWAQPGTIQGAKNTHAAIRNALARYEWPEGVRYRTFLQGSYRNNTHLRRQSDVDVVVELTSLPVRDGSLLPDAQRGLLDRSYPEPEYGWRRFRRDVHRAITASFGASRVREGRKTLKLVMESPEIPVDVVVAVRHLKYTEYSGQRNYKNREGMGLYLRTESRWAVSYPHRHRRNGVRKEKATNGWFRRCIRMAKNARAQLVEEGRLGPATARSYQIECLLYNVPDRLLGHSCQSAYSSALYWLRGNDLSQFSCQNGLVPLFDGSPDGWNNRDARSLIDALIRQYEDW